MKTKEAGREEAALRGSCQGQGSPNTWELLLVQSHGHPKARVQFLINLHFLKRS